MLYQPTNIYPSMTGSLGNGVVDAAKDLRVTWQVNGNSAMVAYQITIYRNNAASTQLYSTGKQTQGCPFYGVDAAGNVQFFSHTIAAAALSGAGITNGGEYKLVIRQWWGSSDAQSVTQTSASAFITRNAPGLTIGEISEPLAVREYTFTALYTQAQGDSLNWVRWQFALVDAAGEYETLRDTGKIYGTGELKFTYDGMFAGSRYAVRCSVQTQNGVEADTGWQEFAVEYTTEIIPGTLTACQTRKGSGVRLNFPPVRNLPAEVTGDYEMEDSYLVLPAGSKAVWDTQDGEAMALSSNCDIVWRGKADAEGTVLKVTGDGLTLNVTEVSLPTGASTSYGYACCAYGNGRYVAAGYRIVATSSNGTDWEAVDGVESYSTIQSACYGASGFVACSESGEILFSEDGVTWTRVDYLGGINSPLCAYGNGIYVIAGSSSSVLTSPDGLNWETQDRVFFKNSYAESLIFDGSQFIAATNLGLYKSINGRTWTQISGITLGYVVYGNGIYLGYNSKMLTMCRSYDAVTWTTLGKAPTTRFGAYGNGVFLMCDYSGGLYCTKDGEIYTAVTGDEALSSPQYICAADNDFFVVSGSRNTVGWLATAQEGTAEFEADVVTTTTPVSEPSFQAMQMNSGAPYNGICFGNGKFVAISDARTFQVSTDGISWTGKGSFASISKRSICYGSRGFACIGDNSGAFVMQSADGETWFQDTQGHLKTDGVFQWGQITYGNGMYVAFGVTTSWGGIAARSTDLKNWSYSQTGLDSDGQSVGSGRIAFTNGVFVALYQRRAIHRSTDGVSWTRYDLSSLFTSTDFIYTVNAANGKFILCPNGSGRPWIFSDDGIVWSLGDQPLYVLPDAVAYGDGFYIATGLGVGIALWSRNGTTWNTLQMPTEGTETASDGIRRVAFGNGRFVAVGQSNTGAYADTTQTTSTLKFQLSGAAFASAAIRSGGDMTLLLGDGKIQWSADVSGSAACYPGFENIRSLELDGKQECDYLMVSDGALSTATRSKLLSDMTYHPVDQDAQFYADFNGSTNGGGVAGTQFTALSIYRLEEGESVLRHIANVLPEDGSVIVDASAVNGRKYTYYAFGVGADTFVTSALISNSVDLCLWDWAVLSCTADENGVYHVEELFLFGKNLVSGGVTNNNAPQILQNFTRYPTIQPAPQNYRSGTLQSLIGTITDCRYSDTREVRDAIWALSTTANTLFLKNRKGDLLRIRTAGAVEMDTGDNSPLQPQTVSLPWVEIGSAEDAQIVITRRDGAWGG